MAAAAKSKTKGKGKATAKRKRVVLTTEDKLEVLSLLDESVSRTIVSEKFGCWAPYKLEQFLQQKESTQFCRCDAL